MRSQIKFFAYFLFCQPRYPVERGHFLGRVLLKGIFISCYKEFLRVIQNPLKKEDLTHSTTMLAREEHQRRE